MVLGTILYYLGVNTVQNTVNSVSNAVSGEQEATSSGPNVIEKIQNWKDERDRAARKEQNDKVVAASREKSAQLREKYNLKKK